MTDTPLPDKHQPPDRSSSPETGAVAARANPYVGPRALLEGELLFGRDRELREALNRLIADRLLLLYSPSGAGKTSLIQAGLVPRLREERFKVLPVVRVGLEPPPEMASAEYPEATGSFNRYIFSAMLSLEQDVPEAQQRPQAELARLSLGEYLKIRSRQPEEPHSRVLIFDQFEEILTQAPLDREGKLAFFDQVGEALLDHHLWALFVIREDFLAGLDPYLPYIPTYLRSTLRLDLLESRAAMLAIQKPVEAQGIEFHNAAARKLVEDLRRVWIQQPDGSMREEPGLYVEPVQLQVVCRRLYRELGLGWDLQQDEITAEDIARLGDVDKALGEYYASEVQTIATQRGLSERDIRDWFGEQLITENLLRGQVLMGEAASGGLANHIIRALEDAHLVRAENRRNSTWFELSHDRMVRPILENNQAWAIEHLQNFQRRADEWWKKDRPGHLLLRGKALLNAKAWGDQNPERLNERDHELLAASQDWRTQNLTLLQRKAADWTQQARAVDLLMGESDLAEAEKWLLAHPDEASPVDQEYFQASREKVQREARARQEKELQLEYERQRAVELRRRNIWLIGLAVITTVAFIVAIYFAIQFNTLATQQSQVAATNAAQRDANAAEAERLGGESTAISNEAATLAADGAINREISIQLQGTLESSQATATAQSSLAQALATEAAEYAYNASLAQASKLANQAQGYLGRDPALSSLLAIQAYETLPNSWEGRNALLTSLQANLLQQVRRHVPPFQNQIRTVWSMDFSRDGRRLAWCGFDGKVKVWNLDQQAVVHDLVVFAEHGVQTVAFSPADSNLLVSGTSNGFLTFWDLAADQGETVEAVFTGEPGVRFIAGPLLSLAFSPDGQSLALSGRNGNVLIWDMAQRRATQLISTASVTVWKLAWSPEGDRLAGVTGPNGQVFIWDPVSGQIADQFPGEDEQVFTVGWSPDGNFLAYAGGALDNPRYTRTIVLLNTNTRQRIEIVGQMENIRSLDFNRDSTILAAGSETGTVRLWDISLAANGIVKSIATPADFPNYVTRPPLQGLAFTPGGLDLLAYFTNEDQIAMYEIGLSDPLNTVLVEAAFSGFQLVHPNVDFRPVDGLLAAGYGPEGEVRTLSQIENDLVVDTIGADFVARMDSGPLLSAALGPDGLVAAADREGELLVWDIQTGDLMWENPSPARRSISLAFSWDGDRLAAGAEGGDIRVFDFGADPPADPLILASDSEVSSLAFSQDGLTLAGGDAAGSVQLWDLNTGERFSLPFIWDEVGSVTAVAFSPDRTILASGNSRGSLALWDISSRQQIGRTIRAAGSPITGLLYGLDGLSLVSAAQGGSVQHWDMDPGSWRARLCTIAGRNFNPDELELFFSDRPPKNNCGGSVVPTETPAPE